MDISGVSANGAVSAVLAQQQAYTQQEVGVTMLKKAIDSQSQGALSLIQTLPQASPVPQPAQGNLGQTINTTA